ncbi:cysteine protease atg4b [Micractinium conductrix]|uniref:Cysteine protease n=1 Tax=Micractinium conductrix TaxID=554055 RepID=A0A2P6VQS9_9CHLO|nr:cysteine protease atg4b [Micractinium conductrix]|eukprot:PSC76415.1 cysteine protease atg4b [Micractinium conductrix]
MNANKDGLSAVDAATLSLSRCWYALARALRLNKLRDLLGSTISGLETPVTLLGRAYACSPGASESVQEEALARLLHHFQSILWMSYRTGFTPIPAGDAVVLRSDAGWGCTLRSGQMILAQGLQRHLLGPDWRWPVPPGEGVDEAAVAPPHDLARLLQLFWDTPADRNAFSLHNLCAHGRRCGVVPGRWLGPWVMCRALQTTAEAALQHRQDLGLTVAVLADAGGGAPMLVAPRYEAVFTAVDGGGGAAGGADGSPDGSSSSGAKRGQPLQLQTEPSAPELVSLDSCTLAVEAPLPAAALARGAAAAGGGGARRGLILLVPLVLGLGKLNPRYAPQLEAVLSWPQSIGVVGGRPSSSLYFVGCQAAAPSAGPAPVQASADAGGAVDHHHHQHGQEQQSSPPKQQQQQQQDELHQRQHEGAGQRGTQPHAAASTDAAGATSGGSSIIYLDPHQVQEAACSDGDWHTFHCQTPRSMPLAAIDPSLALGFYCGSLDEYRDLCARLEALEANSDGAPLLCVAHSEPVTAPYATPPASEWVSDEMSSEEGGDQGADGEDELFEEEGVAPHPLTMRLAIALGLLLLVAAAAAEPRKLLQDASATAAGEAAATGDEGGGQATAAGEAGATATGGGAAQASAAGNATAGGGGATASSVAQAIAQGGSAAARAVSQAVAGNRSQALASGVAQAVTGGDATAAAQAVAQAVSTQGAAAQATAQALAQGILLSLQQAPVQSVQPVVQTLQTVQQAGVQSLEDQTCNALAQLVTQSLSSQDTQAAARLIATVFIQGGVCATAVADRLAALGCSQLTQAISQAWQVAQQAGQQDAFTKSLAGFQALVSALKACLTSQQVICFASQPPAPAAGGAAVQSESPAPSPSSSPAASPAPAAGGVAQAAAQAAAQARGGAGGR